MDMNGYQGFARMTAMYPKAGELQGFLYTCLGLSGEAGEVADKAKKILRDHGGVIPDDKKEEIRDELGDVLWYIANAAHELGFSLEEVAARNLQKLNSRLERGVVSGSGDYR